MAAAVELLFFADFGFIVYIFLGCPDAFGVELALSVGFFAGSQRS